VCHGFLVSASLGGSRAGGRNVLDSNVLVSIVISSAAASGRRKSYRYLNEVAAQAATDQQVAASYPTGDLIRSASAEIIGLWSSY
jgi:hypothetical protein